MWTWPSRKPGSGFSRKQPAIFTHRGAAGDCSHGLDNHLTLNEATLAKRNTDVEGRGGRGGGSVSQASHISLKSLKIKFWRGTNGLAAPGPTTWPRKTTCRRCGLHIKKSGAAACWRRLINRLLSGLFIRDAATQHLMLNTIHPGLHARRTDACTK